MSIHVLGIRHHGAGSARNVKDYLEQLKPDIVLVEGPPEADDSIRLLTEATICPPVAILAYVPQEPQRALFYPFAEFSPEWQAIQYALKAKIPVRFMDLPLSHKFALDKEKESENTALQESKFSTKEQIHADPIGYLAEIAGFDDAEKWWEQTFEHRSNNEQIFEAVLEAMKELREGIQSDNDRMEMLREASMRRIIYQAQKEMFDTIAVVCGAWHAPVLDKMPSQKSDNELLKKLPKEKVECTWIPWTYSRLTWASGYGAGIESPGWYEHLWNHQSDIAIRWMSKVAELFRKKNMDTSVAHVIEAVRLAEALAAMRNLSRPSLDELNEATLSVLCMGESIMLQLIKKELIVSNKIGEVSGNLPKPPLQLDLEKWQKKLRLPLDADEKNYTLDLRKDNDLERSKLLNRLNLLQIQWGKSVATSGKGTFKEEWRLKWLPEFHIMLIEKGTFGNTIEEAATKFTIHIVENTDDLSTVSQLLESALPADLPKAVESLILHINSIAAATGDVMQLINVVPSLVGVSRYGNVRKTDVEMVLSIVNSMITRICISLPAVSCSLDDESAQSLLDSIAKLNEGITLLQQPEQLEEWQSTLKIIANSTTSSPSIAGYCTRLLHDFRIWVGEDLITKFSYTLSTANEPIKTVSWLEGFLKGSGTILLLDEDLWSLVYNWVAQIEEDIFVEMLPLLRRTFANFSNVERRKIGEKVKSNHSQKPVSATQKDDSFDHDKAAEAIPMMLQLLGIK